MLVSNWQPIPKKPTGRKKAGSEVRIKYGSVSQNVVGVFKSRRRPYSDFFCYSPRLRTPCSQEAEQEEQRAIEIVPIQQCPRVCPDSRIGVREWFVDFRD